MDQPCTSMVQHWGIKGKNGPRVAVFVKRDGCRQAAVLSCGHNLSRLWGRLRWIPFKWLTYICWRAAHRRLLTTAVPPREKACKRRCAGELKHLRTPLPAPVRQTASSPALPRTRLPTHLMKVCCLLFLPVLDFSGEEEFCKK